MIHRQLNGHEIEELTLALDAIDAIEVPDAKPSRPLVPATVQPPIEGEVILQATAAELEEAAGRIRRLVGFVDASIFEIGKELVAIKARLEHGEFMKWVKTSFEFTERSAQRYMSVFETFGCNYDTVSYLPKTVIQKLAAPSLPDTLREEVIADIYAGKKPTGKDILLRIADAKGKTGAHRKKAQADKIERKFEVEAIQPEAKTKVKPEPVQAAATEAEAAGKGRAEKESNYRQQAAASAVALLKQHLGSEFLKFCNFYEMAGHLFDQAMREALSGNDNNRQLSSEAA